MHRTLLRIASGLIFLVLAGHLFGYLTWKKNIPADQTEVLATVAAMERVSVRMPGPLQHSVDEIMAGYSLGMSLFLLMVGILTWRASMETQSRFQAYTVFVCLAAMTLVSWLHFFLLPSVFLSIASVLVGFAEFRRSQ